MKNKIILALVLSTLCFSSCSSDRESTTTSVSPSTPNPPVTSESFDYQFTRNGSNTVDLQEGITLIDLFYSLDKGLKNANKFSKDYYTKKGNFGKSVEDITAATSASQNTKIKEDINKFFAQLKQLSDNVAEAKEGQAGTIGYEEETRYVDAKGIEIAQVLQKTIMGMALLDQITNYHLSDQVLKNDKLLKENDNQTLVPNKKYTALEHHWDLAYAYLGKHNATYNPLFIANYLKKETRGMKFLTDIDTKVYKAFYLGRKAATEKNYSEMRAQADIIRKELNTLFAARAIYYLKTAINDLKEDPRNAFHGLSEAYGFLYALNAAKTNNQPYVSYDEIQVLISDLTAGKGFWEIDRLAADQSTKGSLLNISKRIADKFGFNVNEI